MFGASLKKSRAFTTAAGRSVPIVVSKILLAEAFSLSCKTNIGNLVYSINAEAGAVFPF
jgi:hypothetical protein